MNDTSYRRLKVEELDAQAFHEDNEENEGLTGPDERAIAQMVQNQRWADILKELVRSAPLKSKDQVNLFVHLQYINFFFSLFLNRFHISIFQNTKDRACQVAAKALTGFKTSDVKPAVEKLTPEEADILLHYVFRAFEYTTDTTACNTLLAFHDEVFIYFQINY